MSRKSPTYILLAFTIEKEFYMIESRGERFSLYAHMGVTQINFDIDHHRFFVCSWF